MNNFLKKLKINLNSAKKIAIIGHMNTDGDCIWSMLWLGRLLEKQWKKISYFTPTWVSKIYSFLKWVEKIKSKFDYSKYDLIVFVDFSSYDRIKKFFENKQKYFDNNKIVVIDHHLWNWINNSLIFKDISSMSTCEIILELFHKQWKKYFDSDIATYLYLWLTTDSWNFLFDIDHKRIFKNALMLLDFWADKGFIINNLLRKKSLNSIKFMQLLLDRIKNDWKILYTYYDELDLKKYRIDLEEASYSLHVIQNIDWQNLVLLIRQVEDKISCSLRSKTIKWHDINCEEIARSFGWWWHKNAAWFSIPFKSNFKKEIKNITNKIKKIIKTN